MGKLYEKFDIGYVFFLFFWILLSFVTPWRMKHHKWLIVSTCVLYVVVGWLTRAYTISKSEALNADPMSAMPGHQAHTACQSAITQIDTLVHTLFLSRERDSTLRNNVCVLCIANVNWCRVRIDRTKWMRCAEKSIFTAGSEAVCAVRMRWSAVVSGAQLIPWCLTALWLNESKPMTVERGEHQAATAVPHHIIHNFMIYEYTARTCCGTPKQNDIIMGENICNSNGVHLVEFVH